MDAHDTIIGMELIRAVRLGAKRRGAVSPLSPLRRLFAELGRVNGNRNGKVEIVIVNGV